jgi:hypothetical protein
MKTVTSMPAQKLSKSKKNKEWKESCVNYIVGAGRMGGMKDGFDRVSEM